jgi:hypothetical protein
VSKPATQTGTGTPARGKGIGSFDQGDVTARHGIVSARVTDLAEALDTTAGALLQAVEAAGADPLVDTAENASPHETHERPSDPELRCMAFTMEDFREVAAVVGAEEAMDVAVA